MLPEQTQDAGLGTTRITIYVGNLAMVTTEAELRQAFAPFGQVVAVTILNDTYIGNKHPKAYAYVGMADRDAGAAAIAGLDGKALGGHMLSVISALPLSSSRKDVTPQHRRFGPKSGTPAASQSGPTK
jgi:RNA recognition motif-containing protein